ncbi:MAG: DNA-3-methyladenine glycosylase [bacterium]
MLTPEFFARDTVAVAHDLIGAEIIAGTGTDAVTGRIVEAEAYLGQADPASHAGRGWTPRSAIMFGPPAVAYVYLIYGMHHCLNFVTEPEGTPGAVLIRAIEPLSGREVMALRRGLDPAACRDQDIASGPGRLCQALGIDLSWNGVPLGSAAPRLAVRSVSGNGVRVERTPRIGIRKALDLPYRFVAAGSPCLTD